MAREFHTGNDVYSFKDSDGGKLILLNDTAGIDTIDVSANNRRVK